MHVESGTIDIFSDLCDMSYGIAFSMIPNAAKILQEQNDEDLFLTALSLLHTCIITSATTEMPLELLNQWSSLCQKVSQWKNEEVNFLWKEIKRWYRIS
jgi:hypothetical protein